MTKIPNFYILGTAKAGTTTLYHYVRQHPDVCMTRPKEPHFFDVNYDNGLERYRADHLAHCEGATVVGDATPHYLFVPYVPPRIEEHAVEPQFVVILRDPVERAYSDWWMFFSRSTEPLPFREAVEANLRRLEQGPSFLGPDGEKLWYDYYLECSSGAPGEIQHRPYIEMGHYAEQLSRYADRFGEDRVKVFLFEDLVDDPERLAQTVFETLDLPPMDEVDPPPNRNVAMGRLARPIFRLARGLGIEDLVHGLPLTLRKRIKALTRSLGTRPQMDTDIRERLIEHYRPHNQALADVIDRDLSSWAGMGPRDAKEMTHDA